MANYRISGEDLTLVADTIRAKGSTSAPISFPDGFVSAISNIPTGGGSTLITKTIAQNGTYSAVNDNADGYSEVTVNVSSAQTCITGSFIGSSAGSVLTISVPYSGSGYPIACLIYPKTGTNKAGDSMASLVQKYAVVMYSMVKNNINEAPSFDDTSAEKNKASHVYIYKNSDSDPTLISDQKGLAVAVYSTLSPAGSGVIVRFNTATTLAVYIASTQYGFKDGIEYTYRVIYSE